MPSGTFIKVNFSPFYETKWLLVIDLAKKLIKLLKKPDITIKIIGLRPGEKLCEELLCNGENQIPTDDPNIMKLKHSNIDFKKVIKNILSCLLLVY